MIRKIALFLVCAAAMLTAQAQQTPYPTESAAKQTRSQRFDRGLAFDSKTAVMPKGLWVLGMNVSYSDHSNEDYNFLIIKDFNSSGSTLSISPMAHYVFANNQSIGVRFQYKRTRFDLDGVNLDLGDLTDNTTIGPYSFNSMTYMGFLSYRYYLPIGPSKRFLLFNEAQAGVGGGQQKEQSGTNDAGDGFKTGTYQNSLQIRLAMTPGMIVFVTNQLAVEVAVDLLGFNLKKFSQTTDQIYKGSRKTSTFSTKIDFLSLKAGISLYL